MGVLNRIADCAQGWGKIRECHWGCIVSDSLEIDVLRICDDWIRVVWYDYLEVNLKHNVHLVYLEVSILLWATTNFKDIPIIMDEIERILIYL